MIKKLMQAVIGHCGHTRVGPSVKCRHIGPGSPTDATGIDGLVVDGVTYNVTFVTADYSTAYATTPPTFISNPSGAGDAATALSNALTFWAVTGLAGLNPEFTEQLAYIPDQDASGAYPVLPVLSIHSNYPLGRQRPSLPARMPQA